ncbi:MAG: autotransporter outer membrane beta-barrel domain-containing protein, partial [Verrucomicrobiota bacterium]
MKLKNTNKIALRALAITAALATAQAAIITVTSNYTQDTVSNNVANNGPNTLVVNAGGSTLTFGTGATLTANGAPAALNIAAAGYTLNNSGTLDGATAGATAGVTVGAPAILHNLATGTIRSANGQGINITAGSGSTITNAHIIEGSDDAIRTATPTLSVTNAATGTIRGITGANSDGIQALGGLTVDNSGSITGNATGIFATTSANITNRAGATLTGTSAGINVTTGLLLSNDGSISATAASGNGVMATTGAQIANNAGATITGGNDGVQVGGGAAIINAGSIAGSLVTGNGVKLADGSVTNANTGSISGNAGVLVTTGSGSVTNTGTITGTTIGINFAGANTADTLNMNGGTLTGGTLAAPATAVDGGTGNDILNFNGAAATVVGSVLRVENINRNGTGVASITGTTISADTITLAAGNLGSLYLYGAVTPSTLGISSITVNSGVLGGSGTWTSNLTFNGGSLLVHVNPSTQVSDLISVSGNASVAAASVVMAPSSKDAPLQNTAGVTNIRVLDVVGSRIGAQFISPATFYFEPTYTDAGPLVALTGGGAVTSSTVSMAVVSGDATLTQDADDSYVQVVHHYETVAGLTSFGQQFGTFLNGRVAASLTNPVLADFLGYLDYSSAATVASVMNSYEPTVLQASMASAVVGAREIHRIVEQQNAGDRLYPTNAHVWGNFNYDNFTSKGNSSRETLGAGFAIDTLHMGALVSYADSDIGSGATDNVWSYGAYFALGQATGWQWNAYVGGFNGNASSTRSLLPSAEVAPSVHFDPKGDGFQALLSGGYMMEQGSCNWGPTFGMEYISSNMNGGIKPGTNLPAMDFTTDNLESVRSLLGLRADFTLSSNFRPYVSAQWAHEFQGKSNGYTATFQGTSFKVHAP